MKTGVPGVWEEVAKRIQEQTVEEEKVVKGLGVKRPAVQLGARKLIRPAVKVGDKVKRQTTRKMDKWKVWQRVDHMVVQK